MDRSPRGTSPLRESRVAVSERANSDDIRQLIDHLGSRSRRRLDHARSRLTMMGERAVDPLIDVLGNGDTRRRRRAMQVLALIGNHRARGPLIAMLAERSVRVREVAARSLGHFYHDDVVALLGQSLLKERNDTVRVATVTALVEQYVAGQEKALCVLINKLTEASESTEVRLAATQVLRCVDRKSREAWLDRLMEDADEAVARRAAELLATDELDRDSNEKRVDRLIDQLAAEDYTSWNGATQQLKRRGADVIAPLVAEMRRRAHDPEFCRRAGIVFRLFGPRHAWLIGEALTGVEEPLPMQVLVEAIGEIGVKAQIYRLTELIARIAERSETRVDDFDPLQRVRALAHLELARIGCRQAIDDLRAYVADSDRRVEPEMVDALALIGKREELALLLNAWLREDGRTRKRIGDAVQYIMKRERIRRNSKDLHDLARAEKRALRTILPPTASARVALRARAARARGRAPGA